MSGSDQDRSLLPELGLPRSPRAELPETECPREPDQDTRLIVVELGSLRSSRAELPAKEDQDELGTEGEVIEPDK